MKNLRVADWFGTKQAARTCLVVAVLLGFGSLVAQTPAVHLRIGGPAGFQLQSCSSDTPVVCTTRQPHGLAAGDQVIISNVFSPGALNGPKVIHQVLSPMAFSLADTARNPIEGKGQWKDGGLPSWKASAPYGGKSASYQLKKHPRVWLDGPDGVVTRRIATTRANGLIGLTVQSGKATVSTTFSHGLSSGMSVGVFGGDKLNGTYTITAETPQQYSFTTRVTDGTYNDQGITLSSYAHDNNPAWRVIVKLPTECSVGFPELHALRWFVDRSQTKSLECAKKGLLNFETGLTTSEGFGSSFPLDPTKGNGGNADTDFISSRLLDLALNYELIRDNLTADEKQLFLNKVLNDHDSNCKSTYLSRFILRTGTPQTIDGTAMNLEPSAPEDAELYRGQIIALVAGRGAGQSRRIVSYDGKGKQVKLDRAWSPLPDQTSVYEIRATVNATGNLVEGKGTRWLTHPDPSQRLQPGDLIAERSSQLGTAPVVVSVKSDTQITISRNLAWKDQEIYFWKPWTMSSCGAIWFTKHHTAAIAAVPILYPLSGGSSPSYLSNLTLTRTSGEIPLMLALADEDPRAAKRLEEVWSYFFDNNFRFALEYWSGFNQSGSYYGIGRVMWMPAMVAWAMTNSVANFPDLGMGSAYARDSLPFLIYSWYPNSTSGEGVFPYPFWWGTDNADSAISPGRNMQRGFYSPALAYNHAETDGAQFLHWLRKRYQYATALRRDQTAQAFLFVDPNAGESDYRTLPLQRVFRKPSHDACSALQIDCNPNAQTGGFVSLSEWEAPKGSHVSGFVNDWITGVDPDHTTPEAGNYRIWKGGPLVGVDGISNTFPEALASSAEDLTQRGNLIELGGARNIRRPFGDANITRWAGGDPGGDPEGRYAYVLTDLTNYYDTALQPRRVNRHLIHFKKPGNEELVVVYDDIETGKPTSHRSQVHYSQNGENTKIAPEGKTVCLGSPDCSNLNTDRTIYTATQASTGTAMITRFFDPAGALRVYIDNPDGTYQSGRRHTFRVSYCHTEDGGASCTATAQRTEALVAHKLTPDQKDQKFTASLVPAREEWTGVQTTNQVALFSRGGALHKGLSLTTSHGGAAQYLIAGLEAGTYEVKRNGAPIAGSPFTVRVRDYSLYFETEAGEVQVTQVAVAADLLVEPQPIRVTVPVGSHVPAQAAVRLSGGETPMRVDVSSDSNLDRRSL